jgi:hypothetical protein
VAGLGNTLGYHLQMIGDLAGARPYYERALAIFEQVLPADFAPPFRSAPVSNRRKATHRSTFFPFILNLHK